MVVVLHQMVATAEAEEDEKEERRYLICNLDPKIISDTIDGILSALNLLSDPLNNLVK